MAERVTGTIVTWNAFLGVGFIESDFCGDNKGLKTIHERNIRYMVKL